jgi:hypothetical protein
MVFPTQTQCDYCTKKATPSQDINKVTVSLALSVKPSNREEILARHRHLLADPSLQEKQRNHWRQLHTTQMDGMQFLDWLNGVPNQCDCRKEFDALVEVNPPRFDDWTRWTWEIHNAVNAKLNKPEVTWDDAAKLWNWNQHQHTTER